eukprot:2185710-Amphidinium_carterae.2
MVAQGRRVSCKEAGTRLHEEAHHGRDIGRVGLVPCNTTAAVRALVSMMAWKKVSDRGLPLRLASWDVSRAHLYGEVQRAVWCRLPEGDAEPGMVARLLKSVYGLQEASHIWQGH